MSNFYGEFPSVDEVYRALIENEVGWPAFVAEKGSS
jgi:hypothetical protein